MQALGSAKIFRQRRLGIAVYARGGVRGNILNYRRFRRMYCFICKNKHLFKFLDLGDQPPSDAFLRKEDLERPEAKYPLSLYFCEECTLVQIGFVVDPKILFRDYVYTTGMNNSLRANFKALVETLVSRYALTKSDFVIDIGSNDGTLLANYTPHGVNVLGIDPSSASTLAKDKGIPTEVDFFNERTALRVERKYGKAKVITATNVFAHVNDLDSFMRGITAVLREDGVFVSESGYLLDMVLTLGYDAIYHEHLRYYSLRPLKALFERFGMEVFDVERIQSHSGSIRVYAAFNGVHPTKASVGELLALEEKKGFYARQTFIEFARRVYAHRDALTVLLADVKKSGKRIVGIGAPAKGNTLLNFCGIIPETVNCILEKSALKIGLFTPGMHIPVVGEERLFAEQPEYALILAWNIAPELMSKLRQKGFKGKFIIPFPRVKIV